MSRRIGFVGVYNDSYMELAKGDCDAEHDGVACGKKNVCGIRWDDSHGEYGPTFICLSCLNELLEEIPDYIPGFMIDEGT